MSAFTRLAGYLSSLFAAHNTVVFVPKHTVSVTVYRKVQKYVPTCDAPAAARDHGRLFDRAVSAFRPETPPRMTRVVEVRPFRTLEFTVFRKERISIPMEIHGRNACGKT